MNIFGYTDRYTLYSKIPISDKEWFEEYEYNIEDMYSAITLSQRPCKVLRKSTDMLWLQEYLRMITQYIERNANSGIVISDEDIFALFKLPLVRNRTLCKYSIDIYDKMDKSLRAAIKSQDECFLNKRCNDEYFYKNTEDGIVIFSKDIYNYKQHIPYFRTGNMLTEIDYSYDSNGMYLIGVSAEDIVIKNGHCYYNSIGQYSAPCEATAVGVYNANGDFIITIDPATVDSEDFDIMIDGESRSIDGEDIIYSEGQLIIKKGYNYNRIKLIGCPSYSGSIDSPCKYTFSINQKNDSMEIVISGDVLPTEEEIKMFLDNDIFASELYTYNPITGKIELFINPAYYNHAFRIHIATCIFSFSIIKENEDIEILIPPTINSYIYKTCDGCDEKKIKVTYILDAEAALENTYKPVEEVVDTIPNGCKESYLKYEYYCEEGKKYLVTTEYYKCHGDNEWTEGTPSDPSELPDPEECDVETPDDYYYYKCDGCDEKYIKVSYQYDYDLKEYVANETTVNTTPNGCKESYNIYKYVCEVAGFVATYKKVITKCHGVSSWTESSWSNEGSSPNDKCTEELIGFLFDPDGL